MKSRRSEIRAPERSAVPASRAVLLLLGGAVIAGAVLLGRVWASPRPSVLSPRLGRPAVLVQGEAFTVALEGGGPVDGVRLRGLAAVELERAPEDAPASSRWSIPADLAPGKYDLLVTSGSGRAERPGAVHVLARYPETWTIAHIADLPKLGRGQRGRAAMEQLVQELNFRDPDLILVSGDIAYVGGEEGFRATYEWLSRLEPPIVVAIGNHEYKDRRLYDEYWGTSTHYVDMGDLRVISLDSGHGRDQLSESQFRWLAEALRTKGERTAIVHMHHPVFGRRAIANRAASFADLMAEYDVPIVLSGHTHGDRVHDGEGRVRTDICGFPGTKYVTTAPAGAQPRPAFSDSHVEHGYRLVTLRRGALLAYTYDWDGDGAPDPVSSWPVGHLRIDRPSERAATITNELNDGVEEGLVSFHEPADTPPLVPASGAAFDIARTSAGVRYDVRVDVPPRSTRHVALLPAP